MIFLAACKPGVSKHDQAVANAVQTEPSVKAFVKMFPDSEHFITHYTGRAGPRTWNSHVLVHGRYKLTMQFDLTLDPSGVKVTATSAPKYYLNEVASVVVNASGQASISYEPDSARTFGPKEWKKLEAEKGDLSALD